MLASEFVAWVRAAAPARAELRAAGLSADDADEILRGFACPARIAAPSEGLPDELQRLLVAFDCSRFEIASFALQSPPSSHPRGLLVGRLEADPVVLRPDGCVVLLDHASGSTPEIACASSAERFLDALGHRVRAGWGPAGGGLALAAACASIAGVAASSAFWRSIAA